MRLPYEECKEIARTSVCAECGGLLVIAGDGEATSYDVHCGPHPEHQGFKKVESWSQASRQDKLES